MFEIFTANSRGVNYNGLFALAGSLNNVALVPATNPFHIRSQWVNIAGDFIREIDPISIVAAESAMPPQTWNPLRSAASFTNPLEGAIFHTEIFLICPSPVRVERPVVPTANGFPAPPRIAFAVTKATALIGGVIYNDNEEPLRNIIVPCGCSSMFPVLTLNPVYGDPTATNFLFYTELVG